MSDLVDADVTPAVSSIPAILQGTGQKAVIKATCVVIDNWRAVIRNGFWSYGLLKPGSRII